MNCPLWTCTKSFKCIFFIHKTLADSCCKIQKHYTGWGDFCLLKIEATYILMLQQYVYATWLSNFQMWSCDSCIRFYCHYIIVQYNSFICFISIGKAPLKCALKTEECKNKYYFITTHWVVISRLNETTKSAQSLKRSQYINVYTILLIEQQNTIFCMLTHTKQSSFCSLMYCMTFLSS